MRFCNCREKYLNLNFRIIFALRLPKPFQFINFQLSVNNFETFATGQLLSMMADSIPLRSIVIVEIMDHNFKFLKISIYNHLQKTTANETK